YAVVELKVGTKAKGVSAPALISWLRGVESELVGGKERFVASKCYWPPNENLVCDFLVSKRKPKPDWRTYKNVRIFTFCRTLASAKSLAERAVETSDVTEGETPLAKKRSRKQTSFFNSQLNSDSSDDESSCLQITKRVRPADSESPLNSPVSGSWNPNSPVSGSSNPNSPVSGSSHPNSPGSGSSHPNSPVSGWSTASNPHRTLGP
ncbi:DNA-directed RNA polymerase II subunit RPB1, partial [Frankliniella fusca]